VRAPLEHDRESVQRFSEKIMFKKSWNGMTIRHPDPALDV
jgi:hypothetical protein